MISLNSYLEYEKKVMTLLMDKLLAESNLEQNIRANYRYKHQGQVYEFDIVVLGEKERIKTIYEIKTPSAIESNYNFINALLNKYKNVTKADVYLVYLDESNQLQTLLYPNINTKKRETIYNKEELVSSFSEFYSALDGFCCNKKSELKLFFRGHSDYEYEIIPNIFRGDIIKYENILYREALRKNHSLFTEDMSTFDQLVKMQHYGLPTRLLDITTSPLVALYFACKENDSKNGALLIFTMLREQIKYYDSDSVSILSNLTKLSNEFVFSKDKNSLVYEIRKEKPNFNGRYLQEDAIDQVICTMPRLNNERIIRQQGAFFLFGNSNSKDKPAKFRDQPSRILIKAESKQRILRELKVLGIDEASLFPETERIMKQIKNDMVKNDIIGL